MTLQEMTALIKMRFDNPECPQFLDAINVMDSNGDVSDTWKHLVKSGLIPGEFVNDSHRRFAEHHPGELVYPSDRPKEYSVPTSLASVLAIASNPNGILRAEEYAREFARRLIPMGAVHNQRLIWCFTENPFDEYPYETSYLGASLNSARITLALSLEHIGIDIDDFEPKEGYSSRLPLLVCWTIAGWEGWRIASERDIMVRDALWPFDQWSWPKFSMLPNPFEPLLDLWSTGYRIACKLDEDDPTIYLYAKPVEMKKIKEYRGEL